MLEGLTVQIDAYCERTDFGFWAEPVNALSNLAFVAAALFAFLAARRAGRLDAALMLLIALTLAIAAGSFLFHTFAARWAAIADAASIQLFVVAYLTLVLRRFFYLGWGWAVAIGLSLFPVALVVRAAAPAMVGTAVATSAGYLPAAAALTATAVLLARRGHGAGPPLATAAAIFFISLTLRTLDMPLCSAWPLGTHFLWHLLNGGLVGWLLWTMITYGSASALAGRKPPASSRRS